MGPSSPAGEAMTVDLCPPIPPSTDFGHDYANWRIPGAKAVDVRSRGVVQMVVEDSSVLSLYRRLSVEIKRRGLPILLRDYEGFEAEVAFKLAGSLRIVRLLASCEGRVELRFERLGSI